MAVTHANATDDDPLVDAMIRAAYIISPREPEHLAVVDLDGYRLIYHEQGYYEVQRLDDDESTGEVAGVFRLGGFKTAKGLRRYLRRLDTAPDRSPPDRSPEVA